MAAKKKKIATKKSSARATPKKKAVKAKAVKVKARKAVKAVKKPKAVKPKAKAVKAKAKAKPAATKKKVAAKKAAPPARRDATGHLTPQYARELRARSRESRDESNNDRAFLRTSRSNDDLAEELGEEAVAAMTSGEDQSDRLEAEVEEESGGPFVRTRGRDEYARGTDKSNPRSATREPFPKT